MLDQHTHQSGCCCAASPARWRWRSSSAARFPCSAPRAAAPPPLWERRSSSNSNSSRSAPWRCSSIARSRTQVRAGTAKCARLADEASRGAHLDAEACACSWRLMILVLRAQRRPTPSCARCAGRSLRPVCCPVVRAQSATAPQKRPAARLSSEPALPWCWLTRFQGEGSLPAGLIRRHLRRRREELARLISAPGVCCISHDSGEQTGWQSLEQ